MLAGAPGKAAAGKAQGPPAQARARGTGPDRRFCQQAELLRAGMSVGRMPVYDTRAPPKIQRSP